MTPNIEHTAKACAKSLHNEFPFDHDFKHYLPRVLPILTRHITSHTQSLEARLGELEDENKRLREVLDGLMAAVTPEVNEKGAGGYLLARLTDAKKALTKPI